MNNNKDKKKNQFAFVVDCWPRLLTVKALGMFSSAYHLEFDLDTQALLLDSSHTCGEGFPHAGGPSQGELGAALQTSDGARQHSGPAGPAHKQPTDVLPVAAEGQIVFTLATTVTVTTLEPLGDDFCFLTISGWK